MIKLLALDMDGTLLNEQHLISSRNQRAIERARRAGVKVVLASGRPRQGMQVHLEQLQLTSLQDHVIAYNGALLQCVANDDVLYQTLLTGADVKKAFQVAQQIEVDVHAFSVRRGLITHQSNPFTDIEAKINGITSSVVNFHEITDEELFIKMMLVAENDKLDALSGVAAAQLSKEYNVLRSASIFLEVLHRDCNKGIALAKLCRTLAISPEQVMCIGDAENDQAMMRFAGLSVAMDNADAQTKAVADHVTASHRDDGVAKAIEKWILTDWTQITRQHEHADRLKD